MLSVVGEYGPVLSLIGLGFNTPSGGEVGLVKSKLPISTVMENIIAQPDP